MNYIFYSVRALAAALNPGFEFGSVVEVARDFFYDPRVLSFKQLASQAILPTGTAPAQTPHTSSTKYGFSTKEKLNQKRDVNGRPFTSQSGLLGLIRITPNFEPQQKHTNT